MKQFISPGLGTASVLAVFAMVAIHLSSCGDGGPKPPVATVHHLGPVIVSVNDSSGPTGSGTGFRPKIITVGCLSDDCKQVQVTKYNASRGSDRQRFGVRLTTTEDIAANSTIEVEIVFPQDTTVPPPPKKKEAGVRH